MAGEVVKIAFTLLPILSVPLILITISHYLKMPTWLAFIISLILVWGLIVLMAEFHHHQAVVHLESFDLNHDGTFSGSEITPKQQQAMSTVTSDTGRALAPFTGAVFSLIYNLGAFLAWAIVKRPVKKMKKG